MKQKSTFKSCIQNIQSTKRDFCKLKSSCHTLASLASFGLRPDESGRSRQNVVGCVLPRNPALWSDDTKLVLRCVEKGWQNQATKGFSQLGLQTVAVPQFVILLLRFVNEVAALLECESSTWCLAGWHSDLFVREKILCYVSIMEGLDTSVISGLWSRAVGLSSPTRNMSPGALQLLCDYVLKSNESLLGFCN